MKIKRNIYIMYAIALLQGMVFYGAVATLYRQSAGISVFQITIIESISLALALAMELPMGILSDKIGYKNTLVFCSMLYVISKIVFWRADSFPLFLVERLMLSVIVAGLSGVEASIVYLSSTKEYAHKAFSYFDNLGTAGLMIAAGGYSLWMSGDYRMSAFATIFTYGLAAVLSLFLIEVKPAEKKKGQTVREFAEIFKDTLHRKEWFLLLIGVALFRECHQTITVFLNQLQYVRCGIGNRAIGWIYVAAMLAGLLGTQSAAVTGRFGKKKTGVLLFVAAAVSCGVMVVTKSPVLSVLAVILIRIAFSLMMPLFDTIQNQQIRFKNRATALSIYAVIMDSVAVGTNLIFGKAADINVALSMGLGCVFCAGGLLLFLYGLRGLAKKRVTYVTRQK